MKILKMLVGVWLLPVIVVVAIAVTSACGETRRFPRLCLRFPKTGSTVVFALGESSGALGSRRRHQRDP